MLLHTAHGGIRNDAAHTGAPAWASTVLIPIARSSVLFPDMFEPVIRSSLPDGPTSTSLLTRHASGISGCPSDDAVNALAEVSMRASAQSGQSERTAGESEEA